MERSSILRVLAVLASLALFAAACGSDPVSEVADEIADTTDEVVDAATGDADSAEPEDVEEEPVEEEPESPADEPEEAEETEAPVADEESEVITIGYGNAQEFSNYNNGLAASNSVKNSIILNEVVPSPFNFGGPGGALVMDEELMDGVTALSTDPLVIEYNINADAVWSDGDPIDCREFYFFWKAYNGEYVQLDENGDPVVDADTEAELQLFEVTGTTGYDAIESVECSNNDKTVTTTYSEIFADWKSVFSYLMPVHVIEKGAGVDDSIAAFDDDDRDSVEALAEFYNTAWALNPGEIKSDIMPSGSRYMITSWEAGSSLTLTPNPNYWGTPANAEVVVRYIAEEAQAQALANREINAMDPQPTPDLIAQLEGTDGIVIEGGSQFVWEHFDFNFANEALANRDVREAFAYCLPRQQIVSNLIQPLDPSAEIVSNRFNQPFEPNYVDATAGAYDVVDLDRAQELLDSSGVTQPIDIRIGWFDNGGNARRTDQVALTIASCNQIGFNIIDAGSETFFDVELSESDWDIAMFAWAGSPLKTGSSEIYRTGGGINFGGYGNETVDSLLDQINQEVDADEQAKLANEVDAILWEDLVTIPVFSFPGVMAYSDNADGVVYNPSQNGLTFRASNWQVR